MYESKENYLRAIYFLQREHDEVRSVDVADYLGVTKPSVSRAVSQLQESGLLCMDSDKILHLSEKGRALAKDIYEKYHLFSKMLISMGVDVEVAKHDACLLEHISGETYNHIKEFI